VHRDIASPLRLNSVAPRAFQPSEYQERLARARDSLAASGCGGAFCVSPESIYYISGYEGYTYWTNQALVFSQDDHEPTLVVRDVDLFLAQETSNVRDIRTYRLGRDDPVGVVAQLLTEKGLRGATLGIEAQSFALSAAYFARIQSQLGGLVQLQDASRLLARLRLQKSSAELQYVRSAAGMASRGMKVTLPSVRAGKSETEMAAVLEAGLRSAGSEYPAMPTMIASGPRTLSPHATPTTRVIDRGDPVSFWYAGVCHRYHATGYRTVHVGSPSTRFRACYDAAEYGLSILADSVAVGRPAAEAASSAAGALDGCGFRNYHAARWGYGVGVHFPPVWLEALDVTEDSTDTFQCNTVMCLHICLALPEDRFGLVVGLSYVLTESGLEALDPLGPELIIV